MSQCELAVIEEFVYVIDKCDNVIPWPLSDMQVRIAMFKSLRLATGIKQFAHLNLCEHCE